MRPIQKASYHLNKTFYFLYQLEGVGRNSPLSKVGDKNSKLGATIKSWGLTIKVRLTYLGTNFQHEDLHKELT